MMLKSVPNFDPRNLMQWFQYDSKFLQRADLKKVKNAPKKKPPALIRSQDSSNAPGGTSSQVSRDNSTLLATSVDKSMRA